VATFIRKLSLSAFVRAVLERWRWLKLKNCKLCRFSKLCNDLPGVCVLIPYVAVAVVAIAMGYLFITQELM